jgi:hypothetical protein
LRKRGEAQMSPWWAKRRVSLLFDTHVHRLHRTSG